MATELDAYLSRIRPYVRGCPDATMRDTLRVVLRDICQRVNIWWYEERMYLATGIADYDIGVPAGSELATVQRLVAPDGTALVNDDQLPVFNSPGSPRFFRHHLGNRLTVAPVPSKGALYTLELTLKPAIDATTIDDAVYAATAEFAPWGVLAELQRIPGTDWSDPQQANENHIRFNQVLNRKRVSALVGHSSSQHTIQGRRFV
ncbi:hypothetical protein [Endozoicomonas sp. Mp262]|uniref:hypothetical protein n=1 Tax=Endozoicomonas sp. Mp262 TaxID=2919499 RepID=UPI0021D989BD